jgi:hypothetical protein
LFHRGLTDDISEITLNAGFAESFVPNPNIMYTVNK